MARCVGPPSVRIRLFFGKPFPLVEVGPHRLHEHAGINILCDSKHVRSKLLLRGIEERLTSLCHPLARRSFRHSKPPEHPRTLSCPLDTSVARECRPARSLPAH